MLPVQMLDYPVYSILQVFRGRNQGHVRHFRWLDLAILPSSLFPIGKFPLFTTVANQCKVCVTVVSGHVVFESQLIVC